MLAGMDTHDFDVVVVGAGIAGATAAAHLAAGSGPGRRVALIEAEEAAGYHTTGRSAAIWIQNYGPPDIRALSGLSRHFFEQTPEGFAEHPLFHRRPVLFVAPADQVPALEAMLAEGIGLEPLAPAAARAMVPPLRADYLAAAAIERDAFDMDVAALHQGFLRQLRHLGGVLALRARTGRIERRGEVWHVETVNGAHFRAPYVVNAAGAWGDEVAAQAGVAPIGLTPMRRTGAIINPEPFDVADWPLVNDVGHSWYARPEARTRLMVSPADETPMPPHDVQPDEYDIALGIDRMQQALDIPVRRVERAWAGLRTFSPDRSLVIGADPDEKGFFWFVGQGGYGIQTSPAAGALLADLLAGRDPGAAAAVVPLVDPARLRALAA
jgi:D-arginine dehydrogenase